ncbi:MAG: ComEA family DNA-binding protein [Bacteroidota bacterium]
MWGRELRAGLVFVLVSVAAGGAFRGWSRAHHERFAEIVASLTESREAKRAPSPAPPDSAEPPPAASPDREAHASAPALRPASLDVDRASAEELIRLPGIGPALAARIVAERAENGPFGGPDGLLRVRGIGAKTLAKIRGYLSPAPAGLDRAPPAHDGRAK